MFSLSNFFHLFFQGVSWPHLPLCADVNECTYPSYDTAHTGTKQTDPTTMMRIIEFFMMTVDVSTSVLIFVDGTFTVQISRPEECRTMYMHTDPYCRRLYCRPIKQRTRLSMANRTFERQLSKCKSRCTLTLDQTTIQLLGRCGCNATKTLICTICTLYTYLTLRSKSRRHKQAYVMNDVV